MYITIMNSDHLVTLRYSWNFIRLFCYCLLVSVWPFIFNPFELSTLLTIPSGAYYTGF
jgi:hypothetical protein